MNRNVQFHSPSIFVPHHASANFAICLPIIEFTDHFREPMSDKSLIKIHVGTCHVLCCAVKYGPYIIGTPYINMHLVLIDGTCGGGEFCIRNFAHI